MAGILAPIRAQLLAPPTADDPTRWLRRACASGAHLPPSKLRSGSRPGFAIGPACRPLFVDRRPRTVAYDRVELSAASPRGAHRGRVWEPSQGSHYRQRASMQDWPVEQSGATLHTGAASPAVTQKPPEQTLASP